MHEVEHNVPAFLKCAYLAATCVSCVCVYWPLVALFSTLLIKIVFSEIRPLPSFCIHSKSFECSQCLGPVRSRHLRNGPITFFGSSSIRLVLLLKLSGNHSFTYAYGSACWTRKWNGSPDHQGANRLSFHIWSPSFQTLHAIKSPEKSFDYFD